MFSKLPVITLPLVALPCAKKPILRVIPAKKGGKRKPVGYARGGNREASSGRRRQSLSDTVGLGLRLEFSIHSKGRAASPGKAPHLNPPDLEFF